MCWPHHVCLGEQLRQPHAICLMARRRQSWPGGPRHLRPWQQGQFLIACPSLNSSGTSTHSFQEWRRRIKVGASASLIPQSRFLILMVGLALAIATPAHLWALGDATCGNGICEFDECSGCPEDCACGDGDECTEDNCD